MRHFNELEGLRGLAAVIVALYHFLLAFYLLAFFGSGGDATLMQHTRFEDNLYGNPFMALLSGTFAVAIFFVLSGFVLSIKFFQTKEPSVIKSLAVKRYTRLMLPALASVLICYLLIKLGVSHTTQAAAVTQSGWLAINWTFVPDLFVAIREGALGIFISGQSVYNNVLWTMTTEFIGSFLVFGFALLFAHSKHRWIVYGLLLIILFNTWFIPFIIGMLFADLYSKGYLQQRKRGFTAILLVGIAIFCGGFPVGSTANTLYAVFELPATVGINNLVLYTTIGASIAVYAVLTTAQIAKVFSMKYMRMLGRYTFSLYLVHIPVLFTLTTGLFLYFNHFMGYNRAVAVAILCSLPVVGLATWLFERYVDAPAVRFSRYLAHVYEGKRDIAIPQVILDYRDRLLLRVGVARKRVSEMFFPREEDTTE